MADEADPKGGAAPAAKPDPAAPPAAPQTPKASDLPDEALAARLERERKSAEAKLLGSLGVTNADEIKARLKELDDLKTAQLSEAERTQKTIADLTPKAQRAEVLEQRLAAIVEEQFAALPESQRNAIDSVASGNAEKRLELMQVMRAAGLVPIAQPPAAPKPPPPANTAPPVNAPSPAGSETAWDKYAAITNPTTRSLFYRTHTAEIEASRPA